VIGIGSSVPRRLGSTWRPLLLLALVGQSVPACNTRFEFDTIPTLSGAAGMQPEAGTNAVAGTPAVAGSASGGAGAGGGSQTGGGAGTGGMPVVTETCGTLPACPAPLHCADGACVACASDGDCTSSELSRCEPTRHRCVACVEAGDCEDGFACDPLANRCLQKCAQDKDCPVDAHGCDERRLVCYECDENEECAGSPLGHHCATDGSGCVQCLKEFDCPGKHCDQLTGRCVDCRDGQDCSASGLCDPAAGICLP